jgi:hypothetical protein
VAARDKEVWLFLTEIELLIGKVRLRVGIRLAETHNKGYRQRHEAVIALAGQDTVCLNPAGSGSECIAAVMRSSPDESCRG